MAIVASLINMKGGVGKSTLTFNLAWYCGFYGNFKVLAIDLDPQANLSQYFLGARQYLKILRQDKAVTIAEIFGQYSAPSTSSGAPTLFEPIAAIVDLYTWKDGSSLHLVPSRLELSGTLKNQNENPQLLPQFISKIEQKYDLILIDCAPTESILTNAAYRSSRFVFVPVKPEFLATIGFPLLAGSLKGFQTANQNHRLEMGGVIFNDMRRSNTPPEQMKACRDVRKVARDNGWSVFRNIAYHSDSYATGSRNRTPIFQTAYAHDYVKGEFRKVAEEFLKRIQLK